MISEFREACILRPCVLEGLMGCFSTDLIMGLIRMSGSTASPPSTREV